MPRFDEALTILRDRATDYAGMGRSFERLIKTALTQESGHPGRPLRVCVAVGRVAGARRA